MDEVTNALIAGISAKVKLLAENGAEHLGAVGESALEDINEAIWTLAQAGQTAAEEAARRASRLTAWPAITLTVLLSATALCVAFVGGVYYGASGRTVESAPTSAVADWALTPAGSEAYALDKANAATGGIACSLCAACRAGASSSAPTGLSACPTRLQTTRRNTKPGSCRGIRSQDKSSGPEATASRQLGIRVPVDHSVRGRPAGASVRPVHPLPPRLGAFISIRSKED